MSRRPLTLVVLAALAVGCEPEMRHVDIVVRRDTLGFACVEEPGGPRLSARLEPGGEGCFVLDTVALGGFPRCRPEDLRRWCEAQECVAIERETFPVSLPAMGVTDPGGFLIDQLTTHERVEGPVDVGPVLLRLTFVAQPCTEVPALPGQLAPEVLVGCVSSCPVDLSQTTTIDMDLDVVGGQCLLVHVGACSRLGEF